MATHFYPKEKTKETDVVFTEGMPQQSIWVTIFGTS